jgi:hypothetical protein
MCGHWLHLIFFPCSWSAKLDQLTSITGPQVAGHLGYSLMSGFGNAHAQFVGCAMFVACWGLAHTQQRALSKQKAAAAKLETAERFSRDTGVHHQGVISSQQSCLCTPVRCDSCE